MWRSTATVSLLSAASSVCLATVAVVTARALGPTGRGELALLAATASFTMVLSSGGVNIAARVMLAQRVSVLNLAAYLRLCLWLGVAQVFICAGASAAVLHLSGSQMSRLLLTLSGAYGSLMLTGLLLRDGLLAYGANARAMLTQFSGALLQLCLVATISLRFMPSVVVFLAALVCGLLIHPLLALYWLRRYPFQGRPRGTIKALKAGFEALPMPLGQSVILRADRIILGGLVGPSAVGIYSVAVALAEVLWLVPQALSQVLFSRIAGKSLSARDYVKSRRIALGVVIMGASLVAALADVIVLTLFGPEFRAGVPVLRLLLFAAVPLASYVIDSMALAAMGKAKEAARTTAAGAAVAVMAGTGMIAAGGIAGAALASILTYTFLAAGVRRHTAKQTWNEG